MLCQPYRFVPAGQSMHTAACFEVESWRLDSSSESNEFSAKGDHPYEGSGLPFLCPTEPRMSVSGSARSKYAIEKSSNE